MGVTVVRTPKQPFEELPEYMDFVDRLAAGDTVASCPITGYDVATGADVTAQIVTGPTSISGAKVYYVRKGGESGKTYKLSFRAVSAAGAKIEEDLIFPVKES